MNELHRAVLQKHHPDLVRDVIVTESLLGYMYQKHVFDQEMVELIRACSIPSEKISRFLDLLPKRGPEAFDSFMEFLQEQYAWLAKLLQESVATEEERLAALKREETVVSRKEDMAVDCPAASPRVASAATVRLDGDIKSRVSSFVQRQFGVVRRISNTDKKSIERWIGEWLQGERKRIMRAIDEEANEQDVLEHPNVREKMFDLYRHMSKKQGKEMKKREVSTGTAENCVDGAEGMIESKEQDLTADDVSFDFLWAEVTETVENMQSMKKQIDRSFDYIGGRHTGKELSLLVHELCGEFRYQERQLVKERKRIEEMLQELYEYSIMKNKYQNLINTQNNEIMHLQEQLNAQKKENVSLISEITALERERMVHMEKEKTLLELRDTNDNLKTMLHVVNKRNEELLNAVNAMKVPPKQPTRGMPNRRTQSFQAKSNTQKVVPKKPVLKKKASTLQQ